LVARQADEARPGRINELKSWRNGRIRRRPLDPPPLIA